jgi:glycosyltransferase involved in cell wall biosynthesis
LEGHGWYVCEALAVSRHLPDYRKYIQYTRGEFTVAKDQNVRMRSGWFSDRSACYLAAGRPVVTQDTGFGKALPAGEGLFAFNNTAEIVEAFEEINRDYERHARAARSIAEEYFRAETVLSKLIDAL